CIKNKDKFTEQFRFLISGYNIRSIEMMGAIGVEQLKKLNKMVEVRRNNAQYFCTLFKESEFLIQEEIGSSSWFGFSLIIREESILNRNDIVDKLTKNNIETRSIVAGNIAEKEMIRKYLDYSVHGE
ncbi:MAG: CDP-6-deoxy-D-xylo-4-hexulose-3-dehydrase, partial [Candidatus Deianiraeaceae bacterium]